MSEPNTWMPLYVGDYLRDTQHLSTAEHGAYCLLLFRAWTSEGLLPSDPERLRRIVGMTPKEWKAAWPVLREFFVEGPDGYRHKRVDAELNRAGSITEKRRAAANARWQKDSNSNANASAKPDAKREQKPSKRHDLHNHSHNHKEEEEDSTLPLQHRALAFSGRVVRLNRRDFDHWAKTYHAIPDLRAELTALDDWLRENDDPAAAKRWFQIVSGALAKKHQKFLADAKQSDEGEWEMPIC